MKVKTKRISVRKKFMFTGEWGQDLVSEFNVVSAFPSREGDLLYNIEHTKNPDWFRAMVNESVLKQFVTKKTLREIKERFKP